MLFRSNATIGRPAAVRGVTGRTALKQLSAMHDIGPECRDALAQLLRGFSAVSRQHTEQYCGQSQANKRIDLHCRRGYPALPGAAFVLYANREWEMVGRVGIEPTTKRLRVSCSTS